MATALSVGPPRLSEECVKTRAWVNLALAAGLVVAATGCGTTNYLKPEYAPRLSTRSVGLEQTVKSSSPGAVEVLAFNDRRGDRDERYRDQKLVWKGKGLHEYRLQSSLAEYLRGALVFDLARVGFRAAAAPGDARPFSGQFEQRPDGIAYLLGIEVLECRPDYDTHFMSVTPHYIYEYHVKVWDNVKSKLILDKSLQKNITGVGEPGIAFATLMDRLLNDHLAEVNFEIANLLLAAVRDSP